MLVERSCFAVAGLANDENALLSCISAFCQTFGRSSSNGNTEALSIHDDKFVQDQIANLIQLGGK